MNEVSCKLESEIEESCNTLTIDECQWHINLETKQFYINNDTFGRVFNTNETISSVSDLLNLLTSKQQAEVKAAFAGVVKSQDKKFLRCSLKINGGKFVYIELVLDSSRAPIIYGSLRPLLTMPIGSDLLDIFASLFDNPLHGIIVTDLDSNIVACNQHFEHQSGYLCTDIIGLPTRIFNASKHEESFYQNMWSSIHEKGFWNGILTSRHANGSVYPHELMIQKVTLSSGATYYVGKTVDLTSHVEGAEGNGLDVDLLTQLPLKDRFVESLQKRSTQHEKGGYIVLAIEPKFDEHKIVEQKKAFGNKLQTNNVNFLCGYLSNGVYAVAIKYTLTGNENALRVIRKKIKDFILEFKAQPNTGIYQSLVDGRIGVSIIGYDAKSASNSVMHATQAMLGRDTSSTNPICFYQSNLHKQAERRKRLELSVQEALRNQSIDVHYQPIIDVTHWKVVKFEALCRFQVDGDDSFTTQELINAAEDLDLVAEIDHIVGKTAIEAFPQIQQIFGDSVGLTINRSLNTSINAEQVLLNTAELIDSHACSPERITIEITESAFFDSDSAHKSILNELRKHGVTVAIDDFGTGYSSFSYLSGNDFDFLKIDKSFVQALEEGSKNFQIIRMIIDLSHTLGIRVVAEGVETKEEAKLLIALRVDYMQGYLFSKPLPLERIEEALNYRSFTGLKEIQENEIEKQCLVALASPTKLVLDPGDQVSLAIEYFDHTPSSTIPVIADKECVGIIGRREINLHLTPTMGTELENNRESQIWKRAMHQMMCTDLTVLSCFTSLSDLHALVDAHPKFPWVLVDDDNHFKGLVEQKSVLDYALRRP